jgi:branched-chain amino acid transport system permease protein
MESIGTDGRRTTRPPVAAAAPASTHHLIEVAKDAFGWALVALLLAVPLLAFRTTETGGGLAVEPRWSQVAIVVAAVFVIRLVYGLVGNIGRALAFVLGALGLSGWRDLVDTARGWPARLARLNRVGHWVGLLLIALAAILPATPLADRYIMDLAILVLTYVMLGWGLNIVVGLAGLLDLGYVAFYAVGAYSYALLAQHFGLSFWICLPLAGILAAFWGILLGFPVLRLRGDYLAIVTLAFGEIIRIVLINWQSLTGGPNGISGIPRPSFFGLEFNASCGPGTFCGLFGIEHAPIQRMVWLYYIILALALVTAWVSTRVRRLPIGRAWEALREDEIACRALGLNTTTVKLSAFAMGAMFAGFAGSFFATKQGFISPESFTFIESATILAIVVMGGMGSLLGIAIAAIAMVGGVELFRDLDIYRMLVFGLAMVAMMIWRPRGFVASRTPSIALKRRAIIPADLVKEGHG